MTSKSTSPSSIDTQRVPKRRRKTQTDDGPLRQPAANSSPGADGASAGPGTGSGSSGSGGASSSFRNVSACNRCRLRKNRCDQRLPACVSCEKAVCCFFLSKSFAPTFFLVPNAACAQTTWAASFLSRVYASAEQSFSPGCTMRRCVALHGSLQYLSVSPLITIALLFTYIAIAGTNVSSAG